MTAADNDNSHAEQPSMSKRPPTILGRITQAIRTQNWFAVVLELLIVVFGIVIGFQVTAWGDARAARAEELALLRSLKVKYEDVTLVWALVATTTQFSQGVLDGILRSGRLQLIQNVELRTALSEWAGVMADVVEDEASSRDITVQQLEPAMA